MGKLVLSLFVLSYLGCFAQANNSKEIGMWVAERRGTYDSLLFNDKGFLTFYYQGNVFGGETFEYKGEKINALYIIDYTKTPNWIDINIVDLDSNKLIENAKGIIEFLSDDKMMIRIPFDKSEPRPEKFDYEVKIPESMIYTRRK